MGIDWPLVAEAEPHLVNQWFGSLSDMVVAAAAEAAPVQAVAEAVPTAEAVAAVCAHAYGGGCGGGGCVGGWWGGCGGGGYWCWITGYSWTWCY